MIKNKRTLMKNRGSCSCINVIFFRNTYKNYNKSDDILFI